ncbi:hypothetical protein WBJ53_18365 [Spirosoma sp. SC4-14]|uniref:hypothetical protein n=1 Tax=Spirosoma sp. SC4-14 TaxID=3128900 RepID=UPI0030D609B2
MHINNLKKTFDFLQLKDPKTFVEVEHLGQELTKGDEQRIWDDVRRNQQRILEGKRITQRNFGEYSKHNCGYRAFLERVGELKRVESRVNFVSTKMQSDDQTVATTDRPSMGRNFAFL